LHRSRFAALAGVVLTGGCLLLPFVSIDGIGTVGGVDADAWPVVFPAAVVLIAALIGDLGEPPPIWAAAVAAAGALGAAGFVFVKIADARAAVADAGGAVGIGAWALAASAGLALAGAAAGFSRRL
jgi:hypothetical protein